MQQVKPIKGHYLYNMLQDFRHVLVVDLRGDQPFALCQIRDSFCFSNAVTKDHIQELVAKANSKAEEKEKKYVQLKKIRRYLFVDNGASDLKDISQESKAKIELVVSLVPKDPVNKFYYLSQGFAQYYNTYPYTCLLRQTLQKLKQQNAAQIEQEKWLLYPYSKFPSEIIPGKLYLGNRFSSNSEKQLQDLKIKALVDFIDYQENQEGQNVGKAIPDFKRDQAKYSFLHLPINKDVAVNISFDEINQEIEKRTTQGPMLLYCEDGETISAAFAIGYLMWKANLDVTMATLKVCQAISRTDINKWIYTQLLVYKPKKQQ